jgi:hypothetical protein
MAQQYAITIQSLEQSLEGTVGNARFRVRTDRIEERRGDDGAVIQHILDYKTGGKARSLRIDFDALDLNDRATWRNAIGTFQLFLYTVLYAAEKKLHPADIEASYLLLGLRTIDESIEVSLFETGEGEKEEKLRKIEHVITTLIKEMQDPDIPFRPTDHLEEDCPSCPFTSMCGTAWTQRRRSH